MIDLKPMGDFVIASKSMAVFSPRADMRWRREASWVRRPGSYISVNSGGLRDDGKSTGNYLSRTPDSGSPTSLSSVRALHDLQCRKRDGVNSDINIVISLYSQCPERGVYSSPILGASS